MDVFQLREWVVGAYRGYITSLIRIQDDRIRQLLTRAICHYWS